MALSDLDAPGAREPAQQQRELRPERGLHALQVEVALRDRLADERGGDRLRIGALQQQQARHRERALEGLVAAGGRGAPRANCSARTGSSASAAPKVERSSASKGATSVAAAGLSTGGGLQVAVASILSPLPNIPHPVRGILHRSAVRPDAIMSHPASSAARGGAAPVGSSRSLPAPGSSSGGRSLCPWRAHKATADAPRPAAPFPSSHSRSLQ